MGIRIQSPYLMRYRNILDSEILICHSQRTWFSAFQRPNWFYTSEYICSSWQRLWFWRDLQYNLWKNKRNPDYGYKSKKGKQPAFNKRWSQSLGDEEFTYQICTSLQRSLGDRKSEFESEIYILFSLEYVYYVPHRHYKQAVGLKLLIHNLVTFANISVGLPKNRKLTSVTLWP